MTPHLVGAAPRSNTVTAGGLVRGWRSLCHDTMFRPTTNAPPISPGVCGGNPLFRGQSAARERCVHGCDERGQPVAGAECA
jgi:hypothetical protein